jgi:hypothetical protein
MNGKNPSKSPNYGGLPQRPIPSQQINKPILGRPQTANPGGAGVVGYGQAKAIQPKLNMIGR